MLFDFHCLAELIHENIIGQLQSSEFISLLIDNLLLPSAKILALSVSIPWLKVILKHLDHQVLRSHRLRLHLHLFIILPLLRIHDRLCMNNVLIDNLLKLII